MFFKLNWILVSNFVFIQREHARLDSMVLLLMKLDQLDKEIENALSATSSMDNTPILHRKQLHVRTHLCLVVVSLVKNLNCTSKYTYCIEIEVVTTVDHASPNVP